MLRLIAIVAGLLFAARALASRDDSSPEGAVRRFSDEGSEEELEQEVRAGS